MAKKQAIKSVKKIAKVTVKAEVASKVVKSGRFNMSIGQVTAHEADSISFKGVFVVPVSLGGGVEMHVIVPKSHIDSVVA